MKPVKIIPAILAKNEKQFKQEWRKVAPFFSYVQIDIMDGKFVKNKSAIKPSHVKTISKKHTLEIHLMVKDVAGYISLWQKLDNVKKIIWHYEAEPDLAAILCHNNYLKKRKIKTGLSINPQTPINKIASIAKYFDTVQIMGINPGAQGRSFISANLAKIKRLRRKHPRLKIAVDGGVNDKNYRAIRAAGADILVLGHYLQASPDIKIAMKKIKPS